MSKEAVVYIFLGDHFVPCGVLRTETQGRYTSSTFQYGRRYLERDDRVAVDPIQLPLVPHELSTPQDFAVFNGIRDAGPDKWGRYLLDKKFSRGLDEFDYVLASENDRVGALAFGPNITDGPKIWGVGSWNEPKHSRLSLDVVADAIVKNEDPTDPLFRRFLEYGPSIGGARPKGTVDWKNKPTIAKFSLASDSIAMCELEYATMLLARECGIDVPFVDLAPLKQKKVFLIERFDRWSKEEKRIHFISALTATGQHESDYAQHSYLEIADQIGMLCEKPRKDRHELFRRMVFNIFTNNSDDHLRNHGFLSVGREKWRLSPAYDLVPSIQATDTFRLALRVGKEGKVASLENALSECARFDLSLEEANEIIEEVRRPILGWERFFSEVGIHSSDQEKLKHVIRPHLGIQTV